MKRFMALIVAMVVAACPTARSAPAEKEDAPKPKVSKEVAAAREKGLEWLTKNQNKDGSWGKVWPIAITSFACLSYLSASDDPYAGDSGQVLVKGLEYIMKRQKNGTFEDTKDDQSRWIHGQGFGTLALSEAYGRSLFAKTQPDMDMKKVKEAVAKAVKVIEKNQSESGGWWYTPGSPKQHEGSTTVCAVQAIVSAGNYGIDIDKKVLEKGFDYLKKCQTDQGGFNYTLGDGQNMKDGTAAGMATLGLMSKFDNNVMIKAYEFLVKTTPAGITKNNYFPEYGHFYSCMGMQLLGQEFSDSKEHREKTAAFIVDVQKELLSGQEKDGTWPARGWVSYTKTAQPAAPAYTTSFATLTLFIPDGRLSIYNRTPPELPKEKKPEEKKSEEKKPEGKKK